MKDPKTQRAEGAADKVKGKAKEAYGAVTNDNEARLKGQKDQIKGEAKEQLGKARDKVRGDDRDAGRKA